MRDGRSLLLLLLLVVVSLQGRKEGNDQITYYSEPYFAEAVKKDPVKASFFLARFAQAEFEPKCEGADKPIIVPVYFQAGGTVELPCKLCEWGFVVSGAPKSWKVIPLHHAPSFFKNPLSYVRNLHKNKYSVQSLDDSMQPAGGGFHRRARLIKRLYKDEAFPEGTPVPPAQKIASIHNFVQADGKLYIHGTMMESSGIYFCHDDRSLDAHTRIFFVVQAMAPLVYHSLATGSEAMTSVWNVDKWLTSGRKKAEAKCTDEINHPMPDEYAHMRYPPADYLKEGGLKREFVGKLPYPVKVAVGSNMDETNLRIDHEPGEWTPCTKHTTHRYRELHCVLKRVEGAKIPEIEIDYADWASELNSYFDRMPTLRLHSYYLTSLLYKAASYDADPKQEGPTCQERSTKIWEAFRRVILPSLYGITSEQLDKIIETSDVFDATAGKLLNEEACYELVATMKNDLDAKWWSIRGISFIEQEQCPSA